MSEMNTPSTIGLTLLAALLVVAPVQTESQEISAEDRAAIEAGPVSTAFVPFTIRPELTNRNEVVQALMREYPSRLRDARIGGRVVVWFYISDVGRVLHSEIYQSSGHEELDRAALRVATAYRFTPAMNPERAGSIATWIQLPITFDVQGR